MKKYFDTIKYPFIRKLLDIYKTRELNKYYLVNAKRATNKDRMLIYMADGKRHHGGLADRFYGMVSSYNYCKKHNLIFKINFTSPYYLYDFLIPGTYDWTIDQDNISYNSHDAKPIYISRFSIETKKVEKYVENRLNDIDYKQLHIYTNTRYFHPEDFSHLYYELFKPSALLQNLINVNLSKLPNHYVSITFRFQQLLGDFKEDGFPIIKNDNDKDKLTKRCLNCIDEVYKREKSIVLVTSDSTTFLNNAKQRPYVYVVSGNLRHLDFNREKDVDVLVDMKSFVDFYLLSYSDCLYICGIKPLRISGFPKVAALLNNKPIIIIK